MSKTTVPNDQVATARQAVMLVGHGSLRRGSGAAMIRLAARLQPAVAPIAQAAFLNYTRPSVSEGVARCIARGATDITVVPYFLVPGYFVKHTLPKQLDACRAEYPTVTIRQADALGDHEALAQLVVQRANEASYRHAFPQADQVLFPRNHLPNETWKQPPEHSGLLVLAHGSPDASNNQPIYAVAERIRAKQLYHTVTVCFMDLNTPSFFEALDEIVAQGVIHVVVVPYFLQLGNHVAKDLPELAAKGRERFEHITLLLAEHLGYDRLLLTAIADRAALPLLHSPSSLDPLQLAGP